MKVAEILENKKAKDVTIINIEKLTVVADYFVICSATSSLQVRALSDEVDEKLSAEGIEKIRQDGYRESRWIVMDYASVLVHIFHSEEREFYNIERLWSDAGNTMRFSVGEN